MMKKICAVIILITVIFSVPSFALSDEEYRAMMKNPDFARADNKLNDTWKRVSKKLNAPVIERLKVEMREWLSAGRDFDADNFMDWGFSREKAYTEATNKMVHRLLKEEFLTTTSRTYDASNMYYSETKSTHETLYKHEEAQSWLKIRTQFYSKHSQQSDKLLERTLLEEVKFFVLWTEADGTEVMGEWSGNGRPRNRKLEIADKKHPDCKITISFDRKDSVSVTANENFIRQCIGTDEPFEGRYIKLEPKYVQLGGDIREDSLSRFETY